MATEKTINQEVNEQISKFEKTMQELHFLKCVSKDLKNYREMVKLKKYD